MGPQTEHGAAPVITRGRRTRSSVGKTTLLLQPVATGVGASEIAAPSRGAIALDQAVDHIRAILTRTLAKGMEEVGAYLLRTFYGDDPATYHSQSPSKHVSLRALVERCGTMDLPVSATFLSTAIRMAVVARRLPAGASFTKLPVSHRVELLRLPPSDIEPVAAAALRAAMPVRELRKKVATLLVSPPRSRGRPRTPPLMQVSRGLAQALEIAEDVTPALNRAELARLTDAQRAQVKATLERTTQLLRQLTKLVSEE